MRKVVAVIMCVLMCVALAGCGNNKVIDGKEYGTYGLFSESNDRNPDIQYELITGNVVWGILLFETVVAPIYFFGFSMYEPVCRMGDPAVKGVIPPKSYTPAREEDLND